MKKQLRTSVREHITSMSLTDAQLSELSVMQVVKYENEQHKNSRQWFYPSASVAAILLVAASLLFTLANNLSYKQTMVAEIASEVVKNHLHRKPLEVVSGQLAQVSDYFTRLNFVPVASKLVENKGLSLLGGRYCSLQGVTAAQLRFTSSSENDIRTLYQVGYDAEIFKSLPNIGKQETPVQVFEKGVQVTMWVEKGVLFALTEEASLSLKN